MSRGLRRDWTDARRKIDREGRCRVCGLDAARHRIEAAHVVARHIDRCKLRNGRETATLRVCPDDVVPLCTQHHTEYDARRLDLLPYLTLVEQVKAVEHLGIGGAIRRVCGGRSIDDVGEDAPPGPGKAAADR